MILHSIKIIKLMRTGAKGQTLAVRERVSQQKGRRVDNSSAQKGYKTQLYNDNFFLFDYHHYPFPNESRRTTRIYKTTISASFGGQRLQRLIGLSHPHLIHIQKVVKGHQKQAGNPQSDVYYSFYYQEIPFSLKYLVSHPNVEAHLLTKLAPSGFRSTLREVSQYLMQEGIHQCISLQDLGLTAQGQLKVYLSPIAACSDPRRSPDRKAILMSIDRLTGWWQTCLASQELYPRQENDRLKSNKSSFIDKEASQLMGEDLQPQPAVQNMKKSHTKDDVAKVLHASSNSYRTELSKVCSMQLDKMKRIDQQIRFIRERLRQKKKTKRHKESDNVIVDQMKQKKPQTPNVFESERFQKRDNPQDNGLIQPQNQPHELVLNRESIQQNIHTINIYHHPKISTLPSLPYKPLHPTQTTTYHQVYPPIDFDFDNYHNEQEDQDLSVDTYEMQLGTNQQEIIQQNQNYRSTVQPLEREVSQRNYKPKHQFHPKQAEKKKCINQVANRTVTESAGPLQFKNFVNKFIKPQFLAKKSNIYEDPGQEDSQKSKSKRKGFNLFESGKSVASKKKPSLLMVPSPSPSNPIPTISNIKSSQNLKDCRLETAQNFKEYNKQINRQTYISQQQPLSRLDSILRIRSDIRLSLEKEIKNQKSETFLNNRKNIEDNQLSQRVKLVLQKSKNAIALLNRVKNQRSPIFKGSRSP